MAFSENSYHSNAVQGIPQVGTDMNIFDKHSTPRYALGTRIQRQDGNEFVYSHFGADTGPGLLVSNDLSDHGTGAPLVGKVIAPASSVDTSDSTIGSKFIQVTIASVLDGEFAGGYLIVNQDAGVGYTYRIKGNNATGDTATGDVRIELYEKLQVALVAATDITIIPSKYTNLEAALVGTNDMISGVTCSNMDVSAAAYGWICTKGVVGITVDGTITQGDNIAPSSIAANAGFVQIAGGGASIGAALITEPIIGHCLVTPTASLEHGCFYIDLS
jgi:hypothetical protein